MYLNCLPVNARTGEIDVIVASENVGYFAKFSSDVQIISIAYAFVAASILVGRSEID